MFPIPYVCIKYMLKIVKEKRGDECYPVVRPGELILLFFGHTENPLQGAYSRPCEAHATQD